MHPHLGEVCPQGLARHTGRAEHECYLLWRAAEAGYEAEMAESDSAGAEDHTGPAVPEIVEPKAILTRARRDAHLSPAYPRVRSARFVRAPARASQKVPSVVLAAKVPSWRRLPLASVAGAGRAGVPSLQNAHIGCYPALVALALRVHRGIGREGLRCAIR